MDNPIVVFVKFGEFPQLSGDRVNALAWNANGEAVLHPFPSTEKLMVLMLNDSNEFIAEDIVFGNVDAEAPLRVVWHNTSRHHKIWQIEKNPLITRWGMPRECASFSHNEDTDIWHEIRGLIYGELNASKFAALQRARSDLQILERWAAICQLAIIDPELETNTTHDAERFKQEVESAIRQLPLQIGREGKKQWENPPADWPALLKQVHDYAAPLAREQVIE